MKKQVRAVGVHIIDRGSSIIRLIWSVRKQTRIAIMAILLVVACFLTYYFHVVLEAGTVFTHLFYIPIILAALWWKRKGLFVAVFLAAVLIFSNIFLRSGVPGINDYLRVIIFLSISLVTTILSEQIAKTAKALRRAGNYTRHLIESSPDFQVTLNKEDRITDVNKAFEEIVGESRKDLIGTSIYQYLPKKATEKALAEILEKKMVRDIEITTKGLEQGDSTFSISGTVFTTPEGELGIYTTGRDITERKKAEEIIEHLNLVLRAIRNINQLIAKEKERDRLLNGVCHTLIETRGYYNAWLGLVDESGKLVTTAEAGLGEGFLPMVEWLKRGELTACGQKALKQSDVVVTKDPSSTCADCPLAKSYAGRGAMTARLEHEQKIYGFLSASIPAEFAADEEEQALFNEVVGDVAFALHSIELDEERKRAEEDMRKYAEQLEQANIHLQEMDQLKSIFLASMSHELRTPLNSIIGFTGIMLQGMSGEVNEEQRKQLTMVKNSSNHLLSLINDILDISKIEADKVELSLEEFSLADVVKEVVVSLSPMAGEKGLEVLAEVPEGITLVSDRRRIKQVLMNLVSNAVKFTDRGSVRIAARVPGDENLEVCVIDTGAGIKKEDMYKLFQPFQQVDLSLTKKHEGTGLGLYLTKKLADLLGSDISAKSEYGRGSKFTFTMPLRHEEEN